MEQSEKQAGDEGNKQRAVHCGEQTIGDERVQADLLQQAERHVAKEAPGNKQMKERAVRTTEKESDNYDYKNARQERG